MGDLTAVEHVQRQIRANRKPRTALLAEVFGRGGCSSTVRPGSHQQHNDKSDIRTWSLMSVMWTPTWKKRKKSHFFSLCCYVHAVMLLLCHCVRMFTLQKNNTTTSSLCRFVDSVNNWDIPALLICYCSYLPCPLHSDTSCATVHLSCGLMESWRI